MCLIAIIVISDSLNRTIEVYPRRNPSRKARPFRIDDEGLQRVTRSMRRTQNAVLMKGIEDEQKMKKIMYKTV